MLSGLAIEEAVKNGEIVISDFSKDNIQPNGYELHLSNVLLVPDEESFTVVLNMETLQWERVWDIAKPIRYKELIIPEDGIVLEPGKLYLGVTKECTGTNDYVQELKSKSSNAREGIDICLGAGFGDAGFKGYWTLELSVKYKTRIYAGMGICQIVFQSLEGDNKLFYGDKGNYYEQPCYPVPSTRYKRLGNGE